MAKGNKFGTFGGVFTPAILTILGVIMYLRLPRIVGNGGLLVTLGIILAAHVISITTGLSVASIATDKKVQSGGPYYIVSRSLGLPIGGTLGLALFVGLSLSVSLYVIGFCESFLPYVGLPSDIDSIRLYGSLTLFAVTAITVISTSLAIKLQYVILALIVLSLGSIFLGSPEAIPASPAMEPFEGGMSVAVLFGIFFPAVTGFTAGVNMSGDLRDPKQSLPRGTLAAIFVGLAVYVVLAIFLAYRVPVEALVDPDRNVLLEIALSPELVVAGIWGATLSSALGSILGAPRILQAKSEDRLTPSFFAKGRGKTNEPHNALLLTFGIAELGILIGELDVIAGVVSMFFIMTYGFLNVSCAVESWASPDFRPDFKIPRLVPIIGALTCVLIMIQLDLLAMIGATAILMSLFLYFKRKELTLDSGDTWEGIWTSVVRSGLSRLSHGGSHQRNWRPNVLLFDGDASSDEVPLADFGAALANKRGVMTRFMVSDKRPHRGPSGPRSRAAHMRRPELAGGLGDATTKGGGEGEGKSDDGAKAAPYFVEHLRTSAPIDAMSSVVRFHGFTGLRPNTVVLDWNQQLASSGDDDHRGFCDLLATIDEQDHNLVMLAWDAATAFGAKRRIDIWWSPEREHVHLCLALTRFITHDPSWRQARIRFIAINDGRYADATLHKAVRQMLDLARFEATIKVVPDPNRTRGLDALLREESGDTDLTFVGMRQDRPIACEDLPKLEAQALAIGTVVFVRGGGGFPPLLPGTGRDPYSAPLSASHVAIEGDAAGGRREPPVVLPAPALLAEEASRFQGRAQAALDQLGAALEGSESADRVLVAACSDSVTTFFEHLSRATRATRGTAAKRQRRRMSRGAHALWTDLESAVRHYGEVALPSQRLALAAAIERFDEGQAQHVLEEPSRLSIERLGDIWQAASSDSPSVRRAKRRQRWRTRLGSRTPRYTVPVERLRQFYVRGPCQDAADSALRAFAAESYQQASATRAWVSLLRTTVDSLAAAAESGRLTTEELIEKRDTVLGSLSGIAERKDDSQRERAAALKRAAAAATRGYAADLDRLDVAHLTRKQRRLTAAQRQKALSIREDAEALSNNRQILAVRTQLAVTIARLQTGLAQTTRNAGGRFIAQYQGGVLSPYRACVSELEALSAWIAQPQMPPNTLEADLLWRFDEDAFVDGLNDGMNDLTQSLPATLVLATDEATDHLNDAPFDEAETVTVALRRLLEFLIDAELIGQVQTAVRDVPNTIEAAFETARDVYRLIAFQLSDAPEPAAPPDHLDQHGQAGRAGQAGQAGQALQSTDLDSSGGSDGASEDANNAGVWDALAADLRPVVDNGLNRLRQALERLDALKSTTTRAVEDALLVVLERSDSLALSGSDERLRQYVKGRPGEGFGARISRGAKRLGGWLRRGAVGLQYRASAGLLVDKDAAAAHGLTQSAVVDRVLRLVNAHSPKPELQGRLPFFYHQLFGGKSVINEAFWIGREGPLTDAGRAVDNHDLGRGGALLITGPRNAGVTSLCQYLLMTRLSGRAILQVKPPHGGSADVNIFTDALRRALAAGLDGESAKTTAIDGALRRLTPGTVIVLHDIEQWWERAPGGLGVMMLIRGLIERHGERCLFIITVSEQARLLLDDLVGLSEQALGVARCGPMRAEELRDVVLLRHRSTGLAYRLKGREEAQIGELRQARLFTRLSDYAGGQVGVALAAWTAHVDDFNDGVLDIRTPRRLVLDALDSLPVNHMALLLEFLVHRELTVDRLVPITERKRAELERDTRTLVRMGLLVSDHPPALSLNPFMTHLVVRHLRDRGLVQ